jgi:ATP-dependent DNA helicase RecG
MSRKPETHRIEHKRELTPEGLTQAEFFEGYSIPRNKELMRIFKDLELVEHLGSGIPRITQFFAESCFRFTENFLRSTFPAIEPVHAEDDVEAPVTPEVRRMLGLLVCEMARKEIMAQLGLRDVKHFREHYQQAAMANGLIERTLPDKPNSRLQKYRLTEKGRSLLP